MITLHYFTHIDPAMLSGMRPCHSVCLVLIALASLTLGQEESDEELDSGEELDFDDGELSYDNMLAGEVSCPIHVTAHRMNEIDVLLLILQGSKAKKPAKGKCANKGGPKGGLNAQNTKVRKQISQFDVNFNFFSRHTPSHTQKISAHAGGT